MQPHEHLLLLYWPGRSTSVESDRTWKRGESDMKGPRDERAIEPRCVTRPQAGAGAHARKHARTHIIIIIRPYTHLSDARISIRKFVHDS